MMDAGVLSHFALPAPLADVALLFVFLIAAGVTALTFTGFTIWVGYHLIRALAMVLARVLLLPSRNQRRQVAPVVSYQVCPDCVCRTVNPQHARFCRQCGRMIHKPPVHLAA